MQLLAREPCIRAPPRVTDDQGQVDIERIRKQQYALAASVIDSALAPRKDPADHTVGARMKEDFRDLDAVDRALRSGQILRLNQSDNDLKKFDTAIRKIADQALDFVLARLDGPQELVHIILVGGGAYPSRKSTL